MRRESAASPSSLRQPNSALLRPMTQPATSGASWPGFATGLVAVAAGPRPGGPPKPRPPAGGVYFVGVGPRRDSIVAASVGLAAPGAEAGGVGALAVRFQSSKLHG